MAQSIKLGSDTYVDASGIMINSSNSSARKTLQDHVAYTSTTTTFSAGSLTASVTISKKNGMGSFTVSIGDTTGTPFSTLSSGDVIATLPEGYRPAAYTTMVGLMRSLSTWASADFIPVYITIGSSTGEVTIYGNQTQMRSMRYLFFGATYVLAG